MTHPEAFELLPWFVNGTLPEGEHAGVEQHVRACVPCRIALQEQSRLQKLLEQQPLVPLSAEHAFDSIVDEIGRLRRREKPPTAALRLPLFASVLPRHAVTAAVLVASLGVASWLATFSRDAVREAEFVTLTQEVAADFELDIVFADELSTAEREALIDAFGGIIVGGPDGIGRYRVRVDSGTQGIEATLQRLHADDRVRFAARAFVEETAP
jgi:hypothetical protein